MEKVASEMEGISKRLSGGAGEPSNTLLPGEVDLVNKLPSFLRASKMSMQKAATGRQGGKEVQVTKSGAVVARVEKELASMRKRAAIEKGGESNVSSALSDMSNFAVASEAMFLPSYSRREPDQSSANLEHKRIGSRPGTLRRVVSARGVRSCTNAC